MNIYHLHLPTKEEAYKFEKRIYLDFYIKEKVREIAEQVDKMTICNVPTETLLKIKTKIDKELKNREKLNN